MTPQLAADRIEAAAREGLLIQGAFRRPRDDGRNLVCPLAAIHPSIKAVEDCPASVMPFWMAELVVTLFDGCPSSEAVALGVRFAAALRTGRTDDGVRVRWLVRVVRDALASAQPRGPAPDYWASVERSAEAVIAALESGDARALIEAEREAWAAAWKADRDASAWAARAAAWAAARENDLPVRAANLASMWCQQADAKIERLRSAMPTNCVAPGGSCSYSTGGQREDCAGWPACGCPELLFCPFCGGEAEYGEIGGEGEDAGGQFIQCTDARCGASSALTFPCGDDPKPLLRERWNRRTP